MTCGNGNKQWRCAGGWWWWEESVLWLCLVMGVKVIAKQANVKQTVIKQTTRFWLNSILVNPGTIPVNLGTIPVSILECPNSAGLRMHQNEKISRPSCQILLHQIPPEWLESNRSRGGTDKTSLPSHDWNGGLQLELLRNKLQIGYSPC